MNAVVAAVADQGELAKLPVAIISPKDGFNPRVYFDKDDLQDLTESVKQQGVVQPIVVRPGAGGQFIIIAGERRWRAAIAAELTEIPAVIRDVDEKQALIIAAVENEKRRNIGCGEEALLARRVVDAFQGDIEAARRELGWSKIKLDSRLLLLNASKAVLDALNRREISVGHAELLSLLPEQTQGGTLEKLVAEGWSVSELKCRIDRFALDLGTARFSTATCQGCVFNSSLQASLFEQNIGEGRCSNRECFAEKTRDYLNVLRNELEERYNGVWLDTEKAPENTVIVLKAQVGNLQFNEGCKQCGSFGAILSSMPGTEGEITEDVCTNTACYQEKAAAYRASITVAAPETASNPKNDTGNAASKKSGGNGTNKKPGKKTGTTAAASDLPKRVKEHAESVHRQTAAKEIVRDSKMVKVYAILAFLNELGLMRLLDKENDPLAAAGITRPDAGGSRSGLIAAIYQKEDAVLNGLLKDLAARIALKTAPTGFGTDEYLKGTQATLRTLGTNLADHFVVDKPFLEAHTKTGIEGLLNKTGFPAFYNGQNKSEVAFVKLMAKKHAEIVEAVISSDFDFKGFVPDAVKLP